MILRCTAPRKRDRFTECGAFVGAVPNGALVIGTLRHSAHASSAENYVLACSECGTLFEVAPPNSMKGAA